MCNHPVQGAKIINGIDGFEKIAQNIKYHHEHVDGSGYPDGLTKDEIPWVSRVIAVADAYDAMTGSRTYRKPLPPEEAVAELKKNAGTQFDADIVKVFEEKVLQNNNLLEKALGNGMLGVTAVVPDLLTKMYSEQRRAFCSITGKMKPSTALRVF